MKKKKSGLKRTKIMSNKEKTYCSNCGGSSHCKKKLTRKEVELIDNKVSREWYIEVCKICSCDKCEKNN